MQRHRFGDQTGQHKYLGYYFQALPESQAWLAASHELSARDLATMQKAFTVFEPRFARLWAKEKTRLQRAATILRRDIVASRIDLIERDLTILFGRPKDRGPIDIILLMRPARLPCRVGGGYANYGRNIVALEAGDLTSRATCRRQKMLGVFFHELIHATFARPQFEQHLRRWLNQDQATKNIKGLPGASLFVTINEAMTSSLFWQGLLGERYGHVNTAKLYRQIVIPAVQRNQRDFSSWRVFAAYHLRSDVQRHLQRKQRFGQPIVERTISLLETFLIGKPEELSRLR